jgi:integrase
MLSPKTISLRIYQLRRLAESFPAGPWTISSEQLALWFGSHGWGAGTIRSWRSAVDVFYRWGRKTGRTTYDPTEDLPKPPKVRLRPRPAPQWVIDLGMATADDRLEVMIRLGRYAGMRRGEIAIAALEDIWEEDDGWWILVHGKGAKDRIVPISADLVGAVKLWMRDRVGYLFPGRVDGHMAPASVGRLISRHLDGQWTAHPLRHRYATEAYNGSHDLAAVQELLGHDRPETTRIYVEVDRDALRRAASYAA